MRQSDKEELVYDNTGRKRPLTLKKTQNIFSKLGKLTQKLTARSFATNKETVAEILADHFATIASDIGDVNLRNSSQSDLNNHPSVLQIHMANSSEPMIKSNPVNQVQIRNALESLNTRKASGCDNPPARVLKYGVEKRAIPLANLYNSCNRQ